MIKLTQSYYCGASESQIIYETIGNYFDLTCDSHPEVDALVVRHQNVRWSYQQLQEQVNSLATGLLALGVQVGDPIKFMQAAGNCIKILKENKELLLQKLINLLLMVKMSTCLD